MEITLQSDHEKNYTVYSIYWGKDGGKFQRLHNVIEPNDGLSGFTLLSEETVYISDPSLDHFMLHKNDRGVDILIHKAACPSPEFYDALINHDDYKNVEKLFQNMRDMGLVPSPSNT